MAVKTYNADQVKVSFAGIVMHETGADAFVSIKRNAGAFELTMSGDGKGVREQQNNESAQISVTLLMTSSCNALLTAVLAGDKASKNGAGVAPLSVKDLNSDLEMHFAEEAWIRAEPDVTFARGCGERVWVFETDRLRSVHGGH
jgi:hypothetical protein